MLDSDDDVQEQAISDHNMRCKGVETGEENRRCRETEEVRFNQAIMQAELFRLRVDSTVPKRRMNNDTCISLYRRLLS